MSAVEIRPQQPFWLICVEYFVYDLYTCGGTPKQSGVMVMAKMGIDVATDVAQCALIETNVFPVSWMFA